MELKGGRGMWHVDACMHAPVRGGTLRPCDRLWRFNDENERTNSSMHRMCPCHMLRWRGHGEGTKRGRPRTKRRYHVQIGWQQRPKLDCWPMCVCQKFAWTLEFQPHLRQEIKTTKICENWVEKEVMKPECMVVCASISHAVYGAQGTDPNVCQHAAHEVEMVAGGKGEKLDYKEKFKEVGATFLRKNDNHAAKVVKNKNGSRWLEKPSGCPR